MYWLAQLLKCTESLRSKVLDDTFTSICFESNNQMGNDDVVQEKMKETRKLEKENTEKYEKMNKTYARVEADVKAVKESTYELRRLTTDQLKELEDIIYEYNEYVTQLDLGCLYKYKLNSRGDMLSDILGVDFEATLKPKLLASIEDVDRTLCQRQEELETLQQKLHEKRSEKKKKRKENKDLLARIRKLETDHTTVEESMNKYISSKEIEYKKVNNNENEAEAEAEERTKKFKSELEEVTKQYKEKIAAYSNELLQIALDEFAKYKEDMYSLLS